MHSFWPFDKPVWELGANDLSQLEGKEEGWQIEYKGGETLSDLGKGDHIPKSVAAFANHHGGWLVVGVETETTAESTNVPVLPPKGVARDGELDARVYALISGNLSPVPVALVREIPLENGRSVVVIRVPESDDPPHIHKPTGRVFVRRGDAKVPFDWIKDRHELERLYERAKMSRAKLTQLLEKRDYGAEHARFVLRMHPSIRDKVGAAACLLVAPTTADMALLISHFEQMGRFVTRVCSQLWNAPSGFQEPWQHGVDIAAQHGPFGVSVSSFGHTTLSSLHRDEECAIAGIASYTNNLRLVGDLLREAGYHGRLLLHASICNGPYLDHRCRTVRPTDVASLSQLDLRSIAEELSRAFNSPDHWDSAQPPLW